jgi:hypothetical protein
MRKSRRGWTIALSFIVLFHQVPASANSKDVKVSPPLPKWSLQDKPATPESKGKCVKRFKPDAREIAITEDELERRDITERGISVGKPKVYDDSLLQQMLSIAERRLATLQLIDQASIAKNLGNVSGASQQSTGFALNVQGAPLPGVVTTTKLPTQQTTTGANTSETTGEKPSTTSGTNTQTVQNLGVEDVQTTRSAFSPPPAVAPAPSINLPSSFLVSSSDILNEQLQLTAEINGLRLLLGGSLSDYFIPSAKPDEKAIPKFRTTLGFNVALNPRRYYKDAVAIVEVEVRACESFSDDRDAIPAVTSILPRDKTYNVAAIKESNTTIGGGVATQILGVSSSWFKGTKTYYLVQAQDTVAQTFDPDNNDMAGFRWQFRPVLGQHYVKAGLKQTFVQLAFPTLPDAKTGEIGQVTVRSYWRRYDLNSGVLKGIIPGSYRQSYLDVTIPSFKLPVKPLAFNSTQLEDLGGGKMLVKLQGRFLPGTYVRIGANRIFEGPELTYEYKLMRFIASISDLATKQVFLVAQDGSEYPLIIKPLDLCAADNTFDQLSVNVSAVDDSRSKVEAQVTLKNISEEDFLPQLVMVIGQTVYGYSDAKITQEVVTTEEIKSSDPKKVNKKVKLTAIVPNALLVANPQVTVQNLFAKDNCKLTKSIADQPPITNTYKLIPLEKGDPTKFLILGAEPGKLQVLSPGGVQLQAIGDQSHPAYVLSLTAPQLKSNKQLLLQLDKKEPFLVNVPEVEIKKADPPKAHERITVGADEAVIDNIAAKDVVSITWDDKTNFVVEAAGDSSIRIKGLKAMGLTSEATTRKISIKLKNVEKPVDVELVVISSRIESVPQ